MGSIPKFSLFVRVRWKHTNERNRSIARLVVACKLMMGTDYSGLKMTGITVTQTGQTLSHQYNARRKVVQSYRHLDDREKNNSDEILFLLSEP